MGRKWLGADVVKIEEVMDKVTAFLHDELAEPVGGISVATSLREDLRPVIGEIIQQAPVIGPRGSYLWWCDKTGEPKPPTFLWDERADTDTLSPCAVTYVPGHYERLDGGLHD